MNASLIKTGSFHKIEISLESTDVETLSTKVDIDTFDWLLYSIIRTIQIMIDRTKGQTKDAVKHRKETRFLIISPSFPFDKASRFCTSKIIKFKNCSIRVQPKNTNQKRLTNHQYGQLCSNYNSHQEILLLFIDKQFQ